MVKAKDFWNVLCETFNYRFFSGIPCEGFTSLYNNMSSSFMHYIPASEENIALGIVNGATIAGVNSALIIDFNSLYKLNLTFNIENELPITVLAYGNYRRLNDFSIVKLTDNIEQCINRLLKVNTPRVLLVMEDLL